MGFLSTRMTAAFVFAIASLSVGTSVLAQQARPSAATAPDFTSGEIIIGYKTQAARDGALNALKAAAQGFKLLDGGKPVGATVELRAGEALSLRIELPPATKSLVESDRNMELRILEDLSEKIRAADSTIEFAHPNWTVRLEPQRFVPAEDLKWLGEELAASTKRSGIPNDPVYQAKLHWHYEAAPLGSNAVGAWRVTQGDPSIVVAVLDTGIASKHPDVAGAGNLLAGYTFDRGSRRAGAEDSCDNSGYHGTHVAGTIGVVGTNNKKAISGLSWKSRVLPVNVLPCGSGTNVDISDAIRWAAGLEVPGIPLNKIKAQVINLSLGGAVPCTLEKNGYMLKAIESAVAAGTTIVAAAGNESDDFAKYSPAGCPGVVSVSAHDARGKLSWYSNYGNVTILAPGGDTRQRDSKGRPTGVWSIVRPSKANPVGLAPYQGTSMAAPHVAGAIALAMAKHPKLREQPRLVAATLKTTAARLASGACPKPCGAGYLDIGAMVSLKELPKADEDAEIATVTQGSSQVQTELPTTIAPTSAAAANTLNGSWLSLDRGTLIDIENAEWRHPSLGLARASYNASGGALEVDYESDRQKCSYRVKLLDGGAILALETVDPTQSPDSCPAGKFARVKQ